MSGTEITCRDLETGEQDTAVIRDDYLLVTDGNTYLDAVQAYPTTGTVVLTIKKREPGDQR